ncbi:MAG TPA: hypothetical protein VEF34_17185 [Syntrophobacteraceae bacterium]|nr:hypothetical protein [Syntrophobacteraceae bacterium]
MEQFLISPSEFVQAFADEWFDAVDQGRVPKEGPYGSEDDTWTGFIEGEDGVLDRLRYRLKNGNNIQYAFQSIFRFDAAYCMDRDDHPVCFTAFIEHEKGNHPEDEFQKLILVRAPLKVMIFYDWGEFEKNSQFRQNWVKNKLDWFASALQRANALCPEDPATTYLFFIGRRRTATSNLEWFHASNLSLEPVPLERK